MPKNYWNSATTSLDDDLRTRLLDLAELEARSTRANVFIEAMEYVIGSHAQRDEAAQP